MKEQPKLAKYAERLVIYYDSRWNIFRNCDGWEWHNIFETITPSDVFLFKHNRLHRFFWHCSLKGVLCVIEIGTEEYCGSENVLSSV